MSQRVQDSDATLEAQGLIPLWVDEDTLVLHGVPVTRNASGAWAPRWARDLIEVFLAKTEPHDMPHRVAAVRATILAENPEEQASVFAVAVMLGGARLLEEYVDAAGGYARQAAEAREQFSPARSNRASSRARRRKFMV